MGMQRINIKIDKGGGISYDVNGVKGKKCKEVTKFIDDLSGKVLETRVTGEYCQAEEREQIHNNN